MSERIHSSWTVLVSVEDANHDFCLDIFQRPDKSYGFEAFRRDPEDQGRWQPLSRFSILTFDKLDLALIEAFKRIEWLLLEFNSEHAFISKVTQQVNK